MDSEVLGVAPNGACEIGVGKFSASASHRSAKELLDAKGLRQHVIDALDAPMIAVGRGQTDLVKTHVTDYLRAKGWASPITLDPALDLTINAGRDGVALQVQTGNITRAFYDLMKMQSLYDRNKVTCGVLVVPTTAASRKLGSNYTGFDRVERELAGPFFSQITIPIYLVSFE